MKDIIKFADLFAGGGGTSTGAFMVPNIHVCWALNHDDTAIKTHEANHPETKHYRADIRTQNVEELESVNVLWASLECKEHSKAKGGKLKEEGSFTLGWELPRYLIHCGPDFLYIENVPEFIKWGKLKNGKRVKGTEGTEYKKWVAHIKSLGYSNYEYRFLNAADFGCPTKRERYFGIFSKSGFPIIWPKQTHAEKENIYGLPTWIPCKDYIDLKNEGQSIFGREYNEKVAKGKRKPLVNNTLKRIAGGIKKFAPEMYFIMTYYGTSNEGNKFNCHSLNDPMHTIRTHESQALIKVEKLHFLQDHCHTDSFDLLDEPLRTQLTRQTKQLITIESQMIMDNNYNRDNVCNTVNKPMNTIVSGGTKRLITCKTQFLSAQYNSNGNPAANNASLDKPIGVLTTREKFQFITTYFTSGGNPQSQNQSLELPLNTILTEPNKKALITVNPEELFDFDIKMRFITEDESAAIMGFPEGYFKKPNLKLSKKKIFRMIGNAVPPGMAKALLEPCSEHYYKNRNN